MNRDTEPLRLRGWTALVTGLVLIVGVGLLIDPSSWRITFATALIAASSQISGLEWARKAVFSPATHRRELSDIYQDGVRVGAGVSNRRT